MPFRDGSDTSVYSSKQECHGRAVNSPSRDVEDVATVGGGVCCDRDTLARRLAKREAAVGCSVARGRRRSGSGGTESGSGGVLAVMFRRRRRWSFAQSGGDDDGEGLSWLLALKLSSAQALTLIGRKEEATPQAEHSRVQSRRLTGDSHRKKTQNTRCTLYNV